MELKPLLNDLRDVRVADGRYRVQLEIPSKSTLTYREIEKILEMSTWSVNPGQTAKRYEGIRSLVIDRESPIKKGPIILGGLQISGIGYKEFDLSGSLPFSYDDAPFNSPTRENFMNHMKGTKMSTNYARGGEILVNRPGYRALGTYTCTELMDKIKNTTEISTVQLKKLVVPHVEAYGRFLDPELKNEEGNFGFIVFPVPSSEKLRAINEFIKKFYKSENKITVEQAVMSYWNELSTYVCELVNGLRELHDKARIVHLQPHLDNFYSIDGMSYLVDWTTMRRLKNNREENIINRTIDIRRPAENVSELFPTFFPNAPDSLKARITIFANELAMEIYSGEPEKEIDFFSVGQRAANVLKKDPTEFEVVVQWMKDLGLEGHSRYNSEIRKKVGRNEPCPCGSGIKYKRCCGK